MHDGKKIVEGERERAIIIITLVVIIMSSIKSLKAAKGKKSKVKDYYWGCFISLVYAA